MTRSARWSSVLATCLLVIVAACGGSGQTPIPSALSAADKQVEELTQLRMAREQALSVMTVGDLAGALQEDSQRELEPWNSMAVTEVQRRGSEVGPELASLLRAPDRSSFLGLMAIRTVNRDAYGRLGPDFQIGVLVDRLVTATYFNAFGLPHLYWEEPAKAIIEEGQAAQPALSALLSDLRPAPMWGEEEAVEYELYHYRVADYALALIRAIRGDEGPLPQDPGLRDELIRQLQP